MSAPQIDIHNLSFGFTVPVFHNLNLSLPAGQVLGVLGHSGSGKSTLLQVLLGLLTEDTGDVRFDNVALTAQQRRGQGGYVPQKPNLLPWRTVLENLLLPLEVRGKVGEVQRQQAQELLTRFGLADTAGLWPHQLSGGMAQRIAVLRATMLAPQLLFLDEPFSALDALTRLEFQGWLSQMQQQNGATMILITHDVREALSLCHQVVVLSGSPAQVNYSLHNVPSAAPDLHLEQALLSALMRTTP